jgi:hypothetical protein
VNSGCAHDTAAAIPGCCSPTNPCQTSDPCLIPHCVNTACTFSEKSNCP